MKPLAAADLATQEASLESILHTAGAHTWTPQMIEGHKQAELAKAPRPSILYYYRQLFEVVFCIATLCAIAGIVATLACALAYAGALMGSLLSLWIFPSVLGTALNLAVLSTLSLAGIAWLCLAQEHRAVLGPAEWTAKELAWTDGIPMPSEAHALVNKTLALKPDARINVHVLSQDEMILDPILEIDGQYVLVWDQDGKIIRPPNTNPTI